MKESGYGDERENERYDFGMTKRKEVYTVRERVSPDIEWRR